MHAKLILSSCVKTDDRWKAKGLILKQFHLEANYFDLEKWGTLKSEEKKQTMGRKKHSESCSVQKEGKGVGLHGSGAIANA